MSFGLFSTYYLFKKEVTRFLKVYHQTLLAPAVSALIFLQVFILALSEDVIIVKELSFKEFMASGLIIMTMVQNSFANTSSVLTAGKVTGNIVDYLAPPFTPLELTVGLVMGGIVRSMLVGIITSCFLCFFVKMHIYHYGLLIFYSLASSCFLALLGILAGMAAESFDQLSAITAYIVSPLSFLSGTFYSIKKLPPLLYKLSNYNPFFYMIDGFRYSLTDYHDSSIYLGITVLSVSTVILFSLTYFCIKIGWRIKS
jgi:ABC-2 type transport system permease protein